MAWSTSDVCDGDDDGDGVSDDADSCAGTPLDAPFNSIGCSGAHAAENRARLLEATILSLHAAAQIAEEDGRHAQAELMRRRAKRLATRFGEKG